MTAPRPRHALPCPTPPHNRSAPTPRPSLSQRRLTTAPRPRHALPCPTPQAWIKRYRLRRLEAELDFFRTLDTGHDAQVGPRHKKGGGAAQTLQIFCAGLLAGAASRTLTAPGERLKVLLATGQLRGGWGDWLVTLRALVANEGVGTFWRGNLANVLKVAPAKGVKFAMFESAVAAVARNPKRPTTTETLAVSCGVAAASAALTHPLDTIKTMLAAGAQPPTIVGLVRRVVAERGVSGLLVGLGPALMSNVPFVGVSWATFSVGKRKYNEARGMDPLQKPSVTALLGLSFLATACAEAVAYPLYVLKTNLQSAAAAGEKSASESAWRVAARIVAARGPLGLYSGVGVAGLKSAPAGVITWYVYETAKAAA